MHSFLLFRFYVPLSVGALTLEIIGTTEDVHENDIVKIRCIAHGSRPHVHFEWRNGLVRFIILFSIFIKNLLYILIFTFFST